MISSSPHFARLRVAYRVEPELVRTIEKLGAKGISRCFDCGVCSVACPFSEELGVMPFPRKIIKYVKLGLGDRLKSCLEPWLCYYCGDCSNTCPKDADPGEIMAAIRRYLIIKYDFTGISRLMYLTKFGTLLIMVTVAALTFVVGWLLKGPIVLERTELATFAPVDTVFTAAIVVLTIFALILLINAYRMFRFTVGNLKGIPLSKAFIELVKTVPLHFFTQLKLAKCEYKRYWYYHLMTAYGDGIAIILFIPLLSLTLTNSPFLFVDPLSIFGIISTALLLAGTSMAIKGRIERKAHVWKHSHHTDWTFIILPFLATLTGILTGIFRTLDHPLPTYAFFTMHIILVTLLLFEGPFSKWSHVIYRPLAAYFAKLQLIKGGVVS